MNADRLKLIRLRLEHIGDVEKIPAVAYARDVGDLLAALGEARGCCPVCDAPYGDVHKADCTHMLDRSPGVISAAWAFPTISIMESLESLKKNATGQVSYAPIDEVAQRNVLAAMEYAESLPPGDDDDEEEEDDIHAPHGPDFGTVGADTPMIGCDLNEKLGAKVMIENVGSGTITLVGQGGEPSIELRHGESGYLSVGTPCTCKRNVALYGHKPDCPAGGKP